MFMPGHTELIVIGLVVFLIFGAKRLPEIGKGLGGAIREFKNVKKDLSEEVSPPKTGDSAARSETPEISRTLEDKVVDKVMDQVPGLKTAAEMKKKAEKVSAALK